VISGRFMIQPNYMEFINIEIIKVANFNFELFEAASNEYYEEFPHIDCDFELIGGLEYLLTVRNHPIQKKDNIGAKITVETQFRFFSTEIITNTLNEETIRLVSDLLYCAWSYTIVYLNLRCFNPQLARVCSVGMGVEYS
jgi:hypothetical protein